MFFSGWGRVASLGTYFFVASSFRDLFLRLRGRCERHTVSLVLPTNVEIHQQLHGSPEYSQPPIDRSLCVFFVSRRRRTGFVGNVEARVVGCTRSASSTRPASKHLCKCTVLRYTLFGPRYSGDLKLTNQPSVTGDYNNLILIWCVDIS